MCMLFLKIILFLIFIGLLIFSAGNILFYCVKKTATYSEKIIYGFSICLVSFQIIYTIFFSLDLTVKGLEIVSLCISITVIIVNLKLKHLNIKNFPIYLKARVQKCKNTMDKQMLVIIFLILLQCILLFFLQHEDADDAYYITIANHFSNMKTVAEGGFLMGVPDTVFFRSNLALSRQSWEALNGLWGDIFSINPTILMHTVLPPFLLIFHYLSVYNLGNEIFSDKNKKWMFIFFMFLFNVFGFFSVYSQSTFLSFRLWQGKAILVNILLPTLFSFYIKVWKRKEKIFSWEEIFIFFLFCYAGRSLSAIGIYFIPLSLVVYVILFCIREKNIYPLFQSILCILLNLGAAFFMFQETMASGDIRTQIPDYLYIFKMYSGDSIVIFLFFLSIIAVIFENNEASKMLFFYYPIGLFCTIINPLLYKSIGLYLTGATVYWRMLWLLPIQFCISYAAVYVFSNSLPTVRRLSVYGLGIILLLISGTFGYTQENFSYVKNIYKLKSETVEVSDLILEQESFSKNIILAPLEIGSEIRQYTTDLIVVAPKYEYLLKPELYEIFEFTYQNNETIPKNLYDTLQANEIFYIVVNKSEEYVINTYSFFSSICGETDDYLIFRIM